MSTSYLGRVHDSRFDVKGRGMVGSDRGVRGQVSLATTLTQGGGEYMKLPEQGRHGREHDIFWRTAIKLYRVVIK